MSGAPCVEAAGDCPGPGGRVVQFRGARSSTVIVESACNQHHPVGQQYRRMSITRGVEITGGRPDSTYGIVQFGGYGSSERAIRSRGNQHLPVRQQSCRMLRAFGVKATRDRPDRAVQVPWRVRRPLAESLLTSLSQSAGRTQNGTDNDSAKKE